MELTTQQVIQEVVSSFYPLVIILVIAVGLVLLARSKNKYK